MNQTPERDPQPGDHFEADLGEEGAAVTDRGLRHVTNEDAFALRTFKGRAVWAVCDGVSSSGRPDHASTIASRAAVESLAPLLESEPWPDREVLVEEIGKACAQAEDAVVQLLGGEEVQVSATTIVLGAAGPGLVVAGSVGDSRAYWVDGGGSSHHVLTVDDSLAEEAIREGMDPSDAYEGRRAHVITRCLRNDSKQPTPPNLSVVEVAGRGFLVVCSDGLWNYLPDPKLMADEAKASPDPRPIGVASHLVGVAIERGGADNVTVAVIPVGPATI